MDVAYYANYLHWFEQARSFFIRELGMSYREIEARGVILPVREAQCRYRSPAGYEELIQVRTGISNFNRASLVFVYRLYNASQGQALMATGMTHHACVAPNGKPTAVPDWLKGLVKDQ
jgi:acyl-CoA thioester hydrolase